MKVCLDLDETVEKTGRRDRARKKGREIVWWEKKKKMILEMHQDLSSACSNTEYKWFSVDRGRCSINE